MLAGLFYALWHLRKRKRADIPLCSPELREESLKPKAISVALPAELFPIDSHSNHAWHLLVFN